jgi:hypothetical protein
MFTRQPANLSVWREIRVGTGPEIGTATVRPEALERMHARDALARERDAKRNAEMRKGEAWRGHEAIATRDRADALNAPERPPGARDPEHSSKAHPQSENTIASLTDAKLRAARGERR